MCVCVGKMSLKNENISEGVFGEANSFKRFILFPFSLSFFLKCIYALAPLENLSGPTSFCQMTVIALPVILTFI